MKKTIKTQADIKRRQLLLPFYGTLFSGLMFAVIPVVTSVFSPLNGYMAVLVIYWVGFCVPVSIFFGAGPARVSVSLTLKNPWVIVAALLPPVLVFLVAQPMLWTGTDATVLALAVMCALINGPLEELAWRRSFRANSNSRLSYELLGLGIFTLWHVPLYFSQGVVFDYGAVGLIGGAAIPGAIWVFITRASNSVGWPILSHTMVNIAAFIPFFATNFHATSVN